MQTDDIEQQLDQLPLDEPVTVDGHSVYLRAGPDGAELGLLLLESPSERQVQDAVQLGFQSALEFEAGWALAGDGSGLLLTRWLPGAAGWTDAADALEQLLRQAELLRSLVTMAASAPEHGGSREEQRIRSKIVGMQHKGVK